MQTAMFRRTGKPASRLGWPRTVAIGVSLLFVVFGVWAFALNLTQPRGGDFISFWAAGRMVLGGRGAAAYDIAAHRAVELTVGHTGIMPFPYPPPFLAVVTPFALAPYSIAFVLWVTTTAAFYIFASKKIARPEYSMACPPVLVDLLIGQSGLFFGGIIILGLSALSVAPLAAGAILGLAVMKPQLALMLPIALLAARNWWAIVGGLLSSATALLVGFALFGAGAYEGFFHIVPQYGEFLRESRWNWIQLASPFAFLRYFGIAASVALAFQLLIAAGAAMLTWISWRRDWQEKAGILAAATLLASPYLLTYDAVLLIVPAGYLIERRQFWLAGLIWLLSALPVAHFFRLYDGPDTIPVASMLCLGLLVAPHLKRMNVAGPRSFQQDQPEAREQLVQ